MPSTGNLHVRGRFSCIHENQTHEKAQLAQCIMGIAYLRSAKTGQSPRKNLLILILHAYECPGKSDSIHPVWYKYKVVT